VCQIVFCEICPSAGQDLSPLPLIEAELSGGDMADPIDVDLTVIARYLNNCVI